VQPSNKISLAEIPSTGSGHGTTRIVARALLAACASSKVSSSPDAKSVYRKDAAVVRTSDVISRRFFNLYPVPSPSMTEMNSASGGWGERTLSAGRTRNLGINDVSVTSSG